MIETHLAQLKAGAESGKLPSLHPSRDDVMMTPLEGDQFSLSAGGLPQIGTGITQLEKLSSATRRRSPALVGVAVLLGLSAAALAGVLVVKRARDKSTAAAVTSAAIGVDKPVDPTSSSNTTAPPEGSAAKADDPSAAASASAAAAQSAKALAAAAAVVPPHRHFMPAPVPPPPPKAPATTAVDPKGADDPTRDTAARASLGYLTIDTYPWTHVSAGGRALGDTPLVRAALPAGNYTLQLDNPNENVHQSVTVTIKAGETVSRRLAF
jgi:PEGA domain